MPELRPAPQLSVLADAHEHVATRPIGVVYVPCAICCTPLDLAVLADADRAPLCERHRVGDFHPFN
jgi:hypothetical protein